MKMRCTFFSAVRLRRLTFISSLVLLMLSVAPGAVGGMSATTDQPGREAASPAPATALAAVPAFRQANNVAVLTVHGVIDRVTLRSLERRVEEAVDAGADAVVFDINTPGGMLDATLDICHLIKTDAPPNTVAWINPQAYSAGAIIALATREIVMAENARFGDAAPVSPFGPIPIAERAKIESPILEEVIDSAQRNHYDQNLVQAFISVGVELWMLEHKRTGERVFVDRVEYRSIFGEDPPQQMTPLTPRMENAPVRPKVDTVAQTVRRAMGGDPNANEEGGDPNESGAGGGGGGAAPATPGQTQPGGGGSSERSLPQTRAPLTAADRDDYRLLRQVVTSDRLLTVRPADAMFFGLAVQLVRDEEELKAFFGAQTLTRYDENWSEGLARFLMSWPVRGVLIVIFLVCLFIELAAPGTGIFGTAALVALLLLLGAPALMGMAQWWGILLVLIGIALILLELLVIPGVGIAGVLGLVALLIGLVGAFVTGDLGTQHGQAQLWASVTTTITALFAAGVAIWLISRQVKSIPVLDKLVLRTELTPTAAGMPTSQDFPGMEAGDGPASRHGIRTGDLGVAFTDLRPAGRADFDGRIVDVQSPGGFIEQGTPIRVIDVGRYVIDVEEADE
jgi:membrane-bound serine protease (ClpP class)